MRSTSRHGLRADRLRAEPHRPASAPSSPRHRPIRGEGPPSSSLRVLIVTDSYRPYIGGAGRSMELFAHELSPARPHGRDRHRLARGRCRPSRTDGRGADPPHSGPAQPHALDLRGPESTPRLRFPTRRPFWRLRRLIKDFDPTWSTPTAGSPTPPRRRLIGKRDPVGDLGARVRQRLRDAHDDPRHRGLLGTRPREVPGLRGRGPRGPEGHRGRGERPRRASAASAQDRGHPQRQPLRQAGPGPRPRRPGRAVGGDPELPRGRDRRPGRRGAARSACPSSPSSCSSAPSATQGDRRADRRPRSSSTTRRRWSWSGSGRPTLPRASRTASRP